MLDGVVFVWNDLFYRYVDLNVTCQRTGVEVICLNPDRPARFVSQDLGLDIRLRYSMLPMVVIVMPD